MRVLGLAGKRDESMKKHLLCLLTLALLIPAGASAAQGGLRCEEVSLAVTLSPSEPGYFHALTRSWQLVGDIDAVALAVRVQPVGLDIVDDLIASGDLDPSVRDEMPVFSIAGASRTWHSIDGYGCTD